MKLHTLIEKLNALTPPWLAEEWDRVGLHLGDGHWPVRKALLCIDLTEAVLAEAVQQKAGLVLAYHPPIFSPLTRLTGDDARGRILLECARRKIAIYSPHSALDAIKGGMTEWLCAGIGKGEMTPIITRSAPRADQYKLITFVTPPDADKLRKALAGAGLGVIGDYRECSFQSPGQGTFRGGAGTQPYVGKAQRLERVDEVRLEMLCDKALLEAALATLRRVHPYEEPAFDIVPLTPPPTAPAEQCGPGRILELAQPASLDTIVQRIKKHLGVRTVEVARAAGSTRQAVTRVCVCPGSGGSLFQSPNCRHEQAVWFTGEMKHHDVLAAVQSGISVILAGHTETERPYLPVYRERLVEQVGKGVEWIVSKIDAAPLAKV